MREDRWRRIEELYHAARLLNDSARASFLAAATEGDEALRHDVESLLASGVSSPGFLDEPVQTTGVAALVSSAASLSGRRIGTYSVHERIGAGGMGEVYRAHDSKLHRDVAFKVLAADLLGESDQQRQDHLRRFRSEAHALAALNHPNIAAIYGLEEADDVTAIVMELVDGSTLADRIAHEAVPVEKALAIAKQIAEALEAAHERGIVHRDLKPANIKLRSDGTVKVLDFGLAKHTATLGLDGAIRSQNDSVAAVGGVVGTPAYMAPEQVQGKVSDPRTDLFAFGLVLYEMVTGRLPFPGAALGSMLANGMDAVIQPPCQTRSRIAARLNALILRLLERDPARRPASAAAVRQELLALEKTAPLRPARMAAAVASVIVLAAAAAVAGIAVMRALGPHRGPIAYEQLTSFDDAAFEPALSPDGRMMAFLVGSDVGFPHSGQVYTMMLPDGEPIPRTHDTFAKYGVAFSPDGSQITYTAAGGGGWRTMSMPLLGGEPRLLLQNAAGLTWLDRHHLLFSEILTGLHMELVTATERRESLRHIYVPKHERGMAHYSYPSPDRKWILVVEMEGTGAFGRCRLVPFDGVTSGRKVGPEGICRSAAWSPDGRWMYFTAVVDGASHVWREPFPSGALQQITSGPTTEHGMAMSPDGRSLVTSLGILESGAWMHTPQGERPVSPDGYASRLRFSSDGRFLFYLLRHASSDVAGKLWQTELSSGKSEPLAQSFPMVSFDISPDGTQIVFPIKPEHDTAEIWLMPRSGDDPPRRLTASGEDQPAFAPSGQILFRQSEDHNNYLFLMNADGSKRRKVAPIPITELRSLSPDRRLAFAMAPVNGFPTTAVLAVPLDGGPVRRICPGTCGVRWSPDGANMYITPFADSTNKTIAIPVPNGNSMPVLPVAGVQSVADAATLSGSRLVDFVLFNGSSSGNDVAPGQEMGTFAYARTISHRNLFRVRLP
jgi:eukaryotic-like serine/threonine-protein kinase